MTACYFCAHPRRPLVVRDLRDHELGWRGIASDVPMCGECVREHKATARRKDRRVD